MIVLLLRVRENVLKSGVCRFLFPVVFMWFEAMFGKYRLRISLVPSELNLLSL